MSFRARLTLAVAAAVACAIVAASFAVYALARSQLRAEVDRALERRVEKVHIGDRGYRHGFRVEEPLLGGPPGYTQLVTAAGDAFRAPDAEIALPTQGAMEVAAGRRDEYFEDATVAGTHVRILTTQIAPGVSLQIARPLDEVDRTLERLRLYLGAISLGGVGIAALAGLLVAGAALRPVRRMTATAEHVAETRDLSRRIESVGGDDELGRLARAFDAMLEALDASIRAQRQLVADASHELRTPLTSVRTNVEVLERGEELSAEERATILADLRVQLEELTRLVEDLLELARGAELRAEPESVRLDELVADAVDRARRTARDVRFEIELEPSTVSGIRDRLDRAVANLLDNAAKWTPEGGAVHVSVERGVVTVRDEGPGIAADDLPHVFDRFYRAPGARGVPGSGLGLAIVRDVAEEHGGSVEAGTAPSGGAQLRLRLAPA